MRSFGDRCDGIKVGDTVRILDDDCLLKGAPWKGWLWRVDRFAAPSVPSVSGDECVELSLVDEFGCKMQYMCSDDLPVCGFVIPVGKVVVVEARA